MATLDLFGTVCAMGENVTPLVPHNNNWRLQDDWRTPAEFMQWVKRMREEMRRELQADAALWQCPTHRMQRTVLDAMERCALWHYYGVRTG